MEDVDNHRLETLKHLFALHGGRSHRGGNDVETVVAIFERIVSPTLTRTGIAGFEAVAAFARRTPVAACREHIQRRGGADGRQPRTLSAANRLDRSGMKTGPGRRPRIFLCRHAGGR